MDSRVAEDVLRQFKKAELLEVSRDLGLKIPMTDRASDILQAIDADLREKGVPEFNDASDLIAEFLVTAEFCDERGNLVTNKPQPKGGKSQEESKPKCYAYYDLSGHDPACRKCSSKVTCEAATKAARPPCFGLSFDAQADECRVCILSNLCRLALQK